MMMDIDDEEEDANKQHQAQPSSKRVVIGERNQRNTKSAEERSNLALAKLQNAAPKRKEETGRVFRKRGKIESSVCKIFGNVEKLRRNVRGIETTIRLSARTWRLFPRLVWNARGETSDD